MQDALRTTLDSARAWERSDPVGTRDLPTRLHTGRNGQGSSTTSLRRDVDRHSLPARYMLSYCPGDDCMGRRLEEGQASEEDGDVPAGDGTNSPVVILSGMCTHTAAHSEDANFGAANELVWGCPKLWGIVPREAHFHLIMWTLHGPMSRCLSRYLWSIRHHSASCKRLALSMQALLIGVCRCEDLLK